MARRIPTFRSFWLARCRRWRPGGVAALAVGAVLAAGGCASVPLSTGSTAIQLSEAPRWISAVELTRYGCAGGVMGCTSDGGRLSERRCRCPDAR